MGFPQGRWNCKKNDMTIAHLELPLPSPLSPMLPFPRPQRGFHQRPRRSVVPLMVRKGSMRRGWGGGGGVFKTSRWGRRFRSQMAILAWPPFYPSSLPPAVPAHAFHSTRPHSKFPLRLSSLHAFAEQHRFPPWALCDYPDAASFPAHPPIHPHYRPASPPPPLPPRRQPVSSLEGLPKGQRISVRAGGKSALLFWYRDEIYAIEARSPAEGAYSEGFKKARFTQV